MSNYFYKLVFPRSVIYLAQLWGGSGSLLTRSSTEKSGPPIRSGPYVCLFVCLFVCLSVCLSVYFSVFMFVCLCWISNKCVFTFLMSSFLSATFAGYRYKIRILSNVTLTSLNGSTTLSGIHWNEPPPNEKMGAWGRDGGFWEHSGNI